MLWRYFAYRHDFVQNVDHSTQPLGDESDLECGIEPFPTPSSPAVAEASRFAKILIYGSSCGQTSSHRVNSQVPLLNTANQKIPCVPSDKQLGQSHRPTNGTGPVSNYKQASHTVLSPDHFDGHGPHKKNKKPKPWSKDEDAHLTTGVHKFGEGNWRDILHTYSFDNTRSAVELSQRWTLICKRQGTTKPANAKPVSANSDEIKATQGAVCMAIDMRMRKPGSSTLRRSGPSQQSTQHHAPVFGTATPELISAAPSLSFPLPVPVPVPVLVPVQQAPAQAAPLRVSNTSNKPRNNSKKQAAQTNPRNAHSSLQAAAIAAGGRIATQSAATKFLKAAQSTKVVHVRSRGTGSSKTSASFKSSTMSGMSGTLLGSAQHPEFPNCSAWTSSPPVLTTQSTEHVNVVPEVAGVNPQEKSASAHLLETERTMSTTPVSGPCGNMEMDDDSTFCAVTMEDLFPEDVKPQSDSVHPKDEEIVDTKDAAMLEFDRYVASQKKQPKQLSVVGKRIPVLAPAVTSSGFVGTGNAVVLSKALGGQPSGQGTRGEQNRGQEIMVRKQHGTNSKSNGMEKNAAPGIGKPARNAAPGTRTPAKNAASGVRAPARNTAPGAGEPGRNAALGTTGALAKNMAPVTRPLAKNVVSAESK